MHFVNCLDCDEDVIIFDVKSARGGYVCKDGCLKSYEQAGVPIRIHASNASPEQIDTARQQVLIAVKALGKPKEAAKILQNPVTAAELTEALRGTGATVSRVLYTETHDLQHAAAREAASKAPTQPLRVVKTPAPVDEPAADAYIASLQDLKKGTDRPVVLGKELRDTFQKLVDEGVALDDDMTLEQLEREHGFTKSEDGSENRYAERAARMTRTRHMFWWLVHNNIAHPLIGLAPRRATFRFHDWTSRKLHGL